MNCWILSSPRTGGNYLSTLLNETKLFPGSGFDEWLHLKYFSSASKFLSNPPANLNVHWAQFKNVFGRSDKPYLDSILPDKKYIVLKRNPIDQAVSFYVARQTQTWRIYRDKHLKDFLNKKIPIDREELFRCYLHVLSFRDCWKEFEESPDVIAINYDQLAENTCETVSQILEKMNLPSSDLDKTVESANAKFKKMTRPETQQLKEVLRQSETSLAEISRTICSTAAEPQKTVTLG